MQTQFYFVPKNVRNSVNSILQYSIYGLRIRNVVCLLCDTVEMIKKFVCCFLFQYFLKKRRYQIREHVEGIK